MKKTLAAVTAGALLVATQALAMNTAAPTVVDRIGAPAGAADEIAGIPTAGLLFALVTVGAFVTLVSTDDDSESD